MENLVTGQTVRFAVVALLVLLMLVPLAFVQGVADERQGYYRSVFNDIAGAWGRDQTFSGPFLIVPETFKYTGYDKEGKPVEREGYRKRVYLPEQLDLDSEITHQYRYRAVYEVPVYQLRSRVSGRFVVPEPEADGITLLTGQAQLAVGLTRTRAITGMSMLSFGGRELEFESTSGESWLPGGVHTKIAQITPGESVEFAFELTAKGSRTYSFAALGGATQVSLTSSWPHPSFSGEFLPASYQVRETGFDAQWSVHKLARRLPTSWIMSGDELELDGNLATVTLFQPTTAYTVVDRGIKYGILFIGLTFLTFVCFELLTGVRFHYMQYAVVGAALVLFYQTLLSLSEHISFAPAYLLATVLLTAIITWYVHVMARMLRLSLWTAGILLLLYVCLFVLLQLQAYALLVGTGVLIAGLLALMYATRGLAVVRNGSPQS